MSKEEQQGVTLRVRNLSTYVGDYRVLVDMPEHGRLKVPARFDGTIDVTGEPSVARIALEAELIDRRYRITKLTVEPPEGEGVDLAALAKLDLWGELHDLVAHQMILETVKGEIFTSSRPVKEEDQTLRAVIEYSAAYALGRPPTLAVAERLKISLNAAAQRVRRARDAGYLPPTTPGKAS